MAKGDFYDPKTVFELVPELQKYIKEPKDNIQGIGFSSSGNVKFQLKSAGGLVMVLHKDRFPEEVLARFHDVLSSEAVPQVEPNAGTRMPQISFIEPDVPPEIEALKTQSDTETDTGSFHIRPTHIAFPAPFFQKVFPGVITEQLPPDAIIGILPTGMLQCTHQVLKRKKHKKEKKPATAQVKIAKIEAEPFWLYLRNAPLEGKTEAEVEAYLKGDVPLRAKKCKKFIQEILDTLPEEFLSAGKLRWSTPSASVSVEICIETVPFQALIPPVQYLLPLPDPDEIRKTARQNIHKCVELVNQARQKRILAEACQMYIQSIEWYFRENIPAFHHIRWLVKPGSVSETFPTVSCKDYLVVLGNGMTLKGISVKPGKASVPYNVRIVGEMGFEEYSFTETARQDIRSVVSAYAPIPPEHTVLLLPKQERDVPDPERRGLLAVLAAADQDYCRTVDLYNAICDPLINGTKKASESHLYDVKSRTARFERGGWVCTVSPMFADYRIAEDKYTKKDRSGEVELLQMAKQAKYKSACEYIKAELARCSFEIWYNTGAGLVSGTTTIMVGAGRFVFPHELILPSYKDGLTAWKKALHQGLLGIEQLLETKEKNRRAEARHQLGALFHSFLARDIARFVYLNDRYITANATNSYLRGLSMQFGGTIANTDAEGRYQLMSSEEVLKTIREMTSAGIFRTVTLKGTYGKFDILKATGLAMDLVNLKPEEQNAKKLLKTAKSALKNGEAVEYTDFQAEAVYQYLAGQPELTAQDCMILLELARVKGFLCCYRYAYVSLMRSNKEKILKYLEMQKAVEEDKMVRKILMEILQKPSAKKAGKMPETCPEETPDH